MPSFLCSIAFFFIVVIAMDELQGVHNRLKTKCLFVCIEMCHECYSFLVSQYGISGVVRACCFPFGNYSKVNLLLEQEGSICL